MITLSIKPVKYTADTRDLLMRKVMNYNQTSYSHGDIYRPNYKNNVLKNDKFVRLYNLHKVNAKFSQTKYVSGPKKGQTKEMTMTEKSYWIAYVYTFSVDQFKMIEAAGVRQNIRNFIIGKKAK